MSEQTETTEVTQTTVETTKPADSTETGAAAQAEYDRNATAKPLTADELSTIRDLTIKANPDTIPELIGGSTVAEIAASVEPARAAFNRTRDAISSATGPTGPTVPAGGAPAPVVNLDSLSPTELITRALKDRKK